MRWDRLDEYSMNMCGMAMFCENGPNPVNCGVSYPRMTNFFLRVVDINLLIGNYCTCEYRKEKNDRPY